MPKGMLVYFHFSVEKFAFPSPFPQFPHPKIGNTFPRIRGNINAFDAFPCRKAFTPNHEKVFPLKKHPTSLESPRIYEQNVFKLFDKNLEQPDSLSPKIHHS